MLSIFPEFFTYQLLAIFILRVSLGALFVKYGVVKLIGSPKKSWKAVGLLEVVAGAFLLAGFLTQAAALLISLLMLIALIIKIRTGNRILQSSYDFYILLFVMSLSILFLGPGLFAIDLPL